MFYYYLYLYNYFSKQHKKIIKIYFKKNLTSMTIFKKLFVLKKLSIMFWILKNIFLFLKLENHSLKTIMKMLTNFHQINVE